jgi:tetratricopeptide (TPR) repeat protein
VVVSWRGMDGDTDLVGDEAAVGNLISGAVNGVVVQAGSIRQVVLPSQAPPEPLPVPRQLPAAVRDFTGRTDQLAALDTLLSDREEMAVGVVDGLGGIGKTSLVVRWAHRVEDRFPDGTLFANLRGYGPSAPVDAAVVLASFLPALGVSEARIPTELDAVAGLYRSALAGKRVLIVLDNAAHAQQVRPLLPGAAGCVVVVTSRDTLTELVVAQAAYRVTLEAFSPAETQTLIGEILGPGRVNAEPGPVADLARVCAGLPLAVRVAATRVAARPHLAVAEVVADITQEPDPESRGRYGGGAAVESVFDWSYTRLPALHAQVFRRLGLHPGPEFGVAAAAVITDVDSTTVYRCLEALAELHLVEPVGRRRYRMHDLLHAYAAHRATIDEHPRDCRDAVSRVLAWYTRTAQHADQAAFPALVGATPGGVGPIGVEIEFADRVEALAWLRMEQTTLVEVARRASECGHDELVMALAAAIRFLSRRDHGGAMVYVEVMSWGITAARAGGHRALEGLFHALRGGAQHYLGRLDDAESDYRCQLALAEELNDQARRMSGLAGLGWVRLAQDRLPEAREYYQQALPLTRGVDTGSVEAVVRGNLSQICTRLGEFEQALDHANQELVLRRQAGDHAGEVFALHDAALAWQGMGEHQTAIGLCRQAASSSRAMDEIGSDLGSVLLTLATSLELTGELPAAAQGWREALDLLMHLDDPRAEQTRQRLAAVLSQMTGDPHD